jgi:hypothetical protein
MDILPRNTSLPTLFLTIALIVAVLFPGSLMGAERQSKKHQPAQKELVVTVDDSNLRSYLAKADEQYKKGGFDNALRIYLKTYDFTKDVLATVKVIKTGYEKVINEPSATQNEKEDILIKLKRISQFTARYNDIQDLSAYRIGYIYAKKGDGEKARKYLAEVMDSATYSTERDSFWMKTKTLLLSLYNLEGEF